MSTPNESLHAQALEVEMQWLSEVIDVRLKQHFQQEADEAIPPPPELLLDSALLSVIREQGWGAPERLLLALALAPQLRPELLDVLLIRNQNLERGFTEFGGVKGSAHSGFIPTGETASFLFAGSSLEKRFALMQILGRNHSFHLREILALEPSPEGEPVLSGRLTLSAEWLRHLCTGETAKPSFSSEFPAQLVTTPLGWDELVLDESTLNQLDLLSLWWRRRLDWMRTSEISSHWKPGLRVSLHGPAGAGKTLSALLLGKQLSLDVYKVDLKLIGAWNSGCVQHGLDRIFERATNRQWILLIENGGLLLDDEVTATQASNFAYLRMHLTNFPGLVLLESRQSIADEPGLSDIVVEFGLPDVEQRLKLWKTYLPEAKMDGDVRLDDLSARYAITGAQIANVVLRAFLHSAQQGNSRIEHSDLVIILDELKRPKVEIL